ncbi:MAG: lexA 4 [Herbinix sp.]|jgi:repressor LexA|nr:lexA 4 [Herbinix sp.]
MSEEEMKAKPPRERILEYISAYIFEHGYSPCIREIGAAVGLKSMASVSYHVNTMLSMGTLETDTEPGTPRALRVPGLMVIRREEFKKYEKKEV